MQENRWRLVARVLLWTVAAGLGAFTVLRVAGIDAAWPLVAALAYTPYVALASLVPLALAAALRAWRALAVIAASTLVLAWLVLPRALPSSPPAATGPTLRVMTVNMYGGAGDPETVVALVRRYRVDVLTVLELTGSGVDELAAAGIAGLLPHQQLQAGQSVEGSGVYARVPLGPAAGLEPDSQYRMPAVTLHVPGAGAVELMAVHPTAPVQGAVDTWRRELAALPPATPDGAVRVLAGDFNATLDHPPLRGLIATGYSDAGDVTGAGLAGTWRRTDGIGRLLPRVPLDRVLVDARVAVERLSVHDVPGSDHRGVIAELTLPAAGGG
jgi:endonuclease/exonuclease/phosphatase (EEP) superfamily protein YafD